MNTIIEKKGIQEIIKVEGRLDTTNSLDFENDITPVMNGEMKDVVLDCAGLDYISSSGLRVFLLLLKSASAKKGQLVIKNMKAEIRNVFDMTGFTKLFTIE